MTEYDIDKIRHHVAELVTLLKMDGTGSATNRGFQAKGQTQVHGMREINKALSGLLVRAGTGKSTFASAPNPGLQNLPKATMPAYTDPAASQGHDPVHQGLQKHSIGDTYPWAVVGIGNGGKVHYEVHNLCTGKKVYDRDTGKPYVYGSGPGGPDGAYSRAEHMKLGGSLCSFQYLA